ncbi:MAG: J domain-containing protein [Anaplasma sp.]
MVLFAVLCGLSLLFVLPIVLMAAFLLVRGGKVTHRGFRSEDLSAILNRMLHEMQSRASAGGTAGRNRTDNLSRSEALEILGLADGATRVQIISNYHRLMKFVHPDKGGSEYFARKLNQARDKLLNDG